MRNDDGKGFPEITVYNPGISEKTLERDGKAWTINWGALGSVDETTAEKFADALKEAVQLVKSLKGD